MDAMTNPALTHFEPRLGRSVSLDQASRLLGVSRRTLYTWIRLGRLQTIRTLGGSQRVLVDSIRDLAIQAAAAMGDGSLQQPVPRTSRA